MTKVPQDLIDYLAAVRKEGKYNMMAQVGEVAGNYVNSNDSSPEGIDYLFNQDASVNVQNYRNALIEMGKGNKL